MRIESINSVNCLLSAINISKNDAQMVVNNMQINKLTNLSAANFGLSFNGNRKIVQLDDETATKERIILIKCV